MLESRHYLRRLTFNPEFFINTNTHRLLQGHLGKETRKLGQILMNQGWVRYYINTYKKLQRNCQSRAIETENLCWPLTMDLTIPFMDFVGPINLRPCIKQRAQVAYIRRNMDILEYTQHYLQDYEECDIDCD